MASETPKAAPEQLTYANLLFYGSWLAIAILLVTYIVYVSGVLETKIPLEEVSQHWGKPVKEYLHDTGAPTGWAWTSLLGTGDYLNFVGIALLAGMTIICFLILLPYYMKQKDTRFTVIVILEVLVLCLGASGLLGTGGH